MDIIDNEDPDILVDDDNDEDNDVEQIYDEIVRRRNIARRTNWRWRSTSLTQRDVAVASLIQSEIAFYYTLLYLVIFQINYFHQMLLLHDNNRQSPLFTRLLEAFKYYRCLFTFCCYEVDTLVAEEMELLYLRRSQLFPLVNQPARNRSIDELSECKAKELTRFNKEQLRMLLVHWRFPETVVAGYRHRFTGEEVLLVSLARIATGDPWTRLIDGNFGGDPRRWSYAFKWFINHLFTLFYHKISGRSMELWIPEINNLKQLIIDRLCKPAHPREMEYYHDLGERHPPNEYIIEVDSVDDWRVFGFIDDTGVRTCRPGSGPVGLEEGPGRPRRRYAYLIQRAFYR
jgi:hypothetical protein